MNNILETNLHLTHSPISIKDFNRIKKSPVLNTELWREKESLDNASLYIIGKREAPVFVPRREISDEHCLILDVEVGKASFRIFRRTASDSISGACAPVPPSITIRGIGRRARRNRATGSTAFCIRTASPIVRRRSCC